MFVPFEEMSKTSRIWIYPADRELTAEEISTAENILLEFCSQWKAHGHALETSFRIVFNRFILLAADEEKAAASGCSIDSSVHIIQKIGLLLKTDFFDRTRIPFLKDHQIITYPLANLKKLFSEGQLGSQDVTINLLAATKEEWGIDGTITVSESWMSRYLKAAV